MYAGLQVLKSRLKPVKTSQPITGSDLFIPRLRPTIMLRFTFESGQLHMLTCQAWLSQG